VGYERYEKKDRLPDAEVIARIWEWFNLTIPTIPEE
jgi:hypothetical protein